MLQIQKAPSYRFHASSAMFVRIIVTTVEDRLLHFGDLQNITHIMLFWRFS